MSNKISTTPFKGTAEQEAELTALLSEIKGTQGALMTALQKAQGIYGYLPIEVQKMVASGLNLRLEEVYGVATFYSQFSLNPKGKYKISVCMGTACYVKDAGIILNKIAEVFECQPSKCTDDGKFSLEACRCIGACGLAPVITINEDVYGRLVVDDIQGIFDKYKDLPA